MNTATIAQISPSTQSAPASQAAPVPLDLEALRHVVGGVEATLAPGGSW